MNESSKKVASLLLELNLNTSNFLEEDRTGRYNIHTKRNNITKKDVLNKCLKIKNKEFKMLFYAKK